MRVDYEYADETRSCWIELFDARERGRAGLRIGLISFRGDFADQKDLPADDDQYAYTHGGEEYRAAVRAAWKAIRRDQDVIEAPPGHIVV